MSSVVFLRGVNVGGHKSFRPSLLAKELTHFSVVNVGAAGTFVVHKKMAQKTLRAEFARRLSFEADLMICRGEEVRDLVASEPFPAAKDARRFVSVMSRQPAKPPRLPLSEPPGNRWEVKVIAVSGAFALSVGRRLGKTYVDPNAVVEKGFAVRATTRNWNTIVKVANILRTGGRTTPE